MNMAAVQRREARLIFLRFLAEESNRSLTSSALTIQLNEMFLMNKDRTWVEQELAYLAEYGAIRLTSAGTVKIATLTKQGAKHLNWSVTIPDVLRPSEQMMLPEADA